HAPEEGGAAPLSSPDADHLPGSVLLARSAPIRRRHRRRAAARAPHRARPGVADHGRQAVRARWIAPSANGQLPAPILRRPAPTHRDRARPRLVAETDRRRRAGLRARRLDPGPGAQPDAGPAARARPRLSLHLAQSRGGRAYKPPHRGDVSRPHRRVYRQADIVQEGVAYLHRIAAAGSPDSRPEGQTAKTRAAGRRAESGDPPGGMPFPPPLPLCRRPVSERVAEAARGQARPIRVLSSAVTIANPGADPDNETVPSRREGAARRNSGARSLAAGGRQHVEPAARRLRRRSREDRGSE